MDNENGITQGMDAIINECLRVYPGQTSPKSYGTLISWEFGGDDPLDVIDVYDGGDYWHFVTFGLSELYEKTQDDKDISGYGMEFTFKLKKRCGDDEEKEILGICSILQMIARATFNSGELFKPYEFLYSGQTCGIDAKQKSSITGFITIPDKDLQTIMTPNGRVDFVEFIGVTDAELMAVRKKITDVKSLYEKLGSDVTDYGRSSLY